MRTSVVIPTYRRPDVLRQAVASLFDATLHPDEVIIVGRKSDHETVAAVTALQQHDIYGAYIKSAWVTIPGHIPPVETGLKTASGDVIAVIDDDVTVTSGWLAQISSHFHDPAIGLVGGQVIVPGVAAPYPKGKPGQISWYGNYGGDIGSVDGTTSFPVVAVMEGNCAWRRVLADNLVYDPVLNFDDASMYGLDMGLQAKQKKFEVLYDPRALVYHHAAPRSPELDRIQRPRRAFSFTRNYTYIMLKHLPWWQKVTFLGWWFLIGGRGGWGLAAVLDEILRHGLRRRREFATTLAGKVEGIRLWLIFRKQRKGARIP